MNTKLIRVQIVSPYYRNSILATSYTLSYNKGSKDCELEIATNEGDVLELNVPYTQAGEFQIQVEGVDVAETQVVQFKMDSVGPVINV